MRMRLLIGLMCVGALLLGGCGGGDGEKPKVIGAALLTQTHVFYQDMVAEMQKTAQEKGLKLRVQYAEFDSRKQNDQMEIFIAQGVDAIIVAPTDSSGIAPVVADARAKGIPVFTVDIAAHGADIVSHIASDNEKGGELVAEFLAKALNGKGKVAVIDHPEVSSVQERTRGFDQVMKQYPDIAVVARVPGLGQRDKSMRVAQDLLQAHPDLNGIFGINDESALGAMAAVESAGKDKDIVIVGIDGTTEALEAIKKGKAIKADAVQFPKKIGAKTIEIIAAALSGEQVPALAPVEVVLEDKLSLTREDQS